jgi:S1-C subfamily serine protease
MRTAFAVGLVSLSAVAVPAEEFPRAAADRARSATVRVVNTAGDTHGSGVLIKRSGSHVHILTACHLVSRAKAVEVRVAPDRVYRATVLAEEPEVDLAILRLAPRDELPSPLALAPVGAGDRPGPAVSVGWESGEAPTICAETVTGQLRLRRPGGPGAVRHWATARPQAAGRSGGPLVGPSGAIIGLASGRDDSAGYYVHADEIHGFLRRHGLKWLAEDDDR